MQLMIKPTIACSFKCEFCSAHCVKQQNVTCANMKQYINEIAKNNPDDIIITGGDPLENDIAFFDELLKINDHTTLSLTTNLHRFQENPTKWTPLFKNPRVGVCTSFQYGDMRKKPDGTPYTEADFIRVSKLFRDNVGYTPKFIAVISDENKSRAIDHVYLAKSLDTTCKINAMLPIGISQSYFPRYKLLDIYFDIIDRGLEYYEDNVFERAKGNCPFNVDGLCATHNRALKFNSDGTFSYSRCDEMISMLHSSNLHAEGKYLRGSELITQECLSCELCRFCNGCDINRAIAHRDPEYCIQMKSRKNKLEKYGFKL